MSITTILFAIIVIAIGLAFLKFLLSIGRIVLRLALQILTGLVLLHLVNFLPFVHIPINILTVLVAGFGGITGVGVLILLRILGLL
ncbi:conserved hypothetical protein [Methanothermus fervidus DSM 2088]|uniref:SigmaK-factor processing regulatory BofA n=1 Tax=Methanothermus fervidus (strain ATCC 43054 / DSM 2088 / JCM 10308 / V24 S) TaxID=523846 RepID=E3GWS9_METFV|nr:pro-sigmaK processing inhibitor BofA family protein [Methanothermus fervidus]ADP77998.1 conserved hypothetical protein [Methanothermus fervidus DSM 2088]